MQPLFQKSCFYQELSIKAAKRARVARRLSDLKSAFANRLFFSNNSRNRKDSLRGHIERMASRSSNPVSACRLRAQCSTTCGRPLPDKARALQQPPKAPCAPRRFGFRRDIAKRAYLYIRSWRFTQYPLVPMRYFFLLTRFYRAKYRSFRTISP